MHDLDRYWARHHIVCCASTNEAFKPGNNFSVPQEARTRSREARLRSSGRRAGKTRSASKGEGRMGEHVPILSGDGRSQISTDTRASADTTDRRRLAPEELHYSCARSR